jgi:hypothetical protein
VKGILTDICAAIRMGKTCHPVPPLTSSTPSATIPLYYLPLQATKCPFAVRSVVFLIVLTAYVLGGVVDPLARPSTCALVSLKLFMQQSKHVTPLVDKIFCKNHKALLLIGFLLCYLQVKQSGLKMYQKVQFSAGLQVDCNHVRIHEVTARRIPQMVTL